MTRNQKRVIKSIAYGALSALVASFVVTLLLMMFLPGGFGHPESDTSQMLSMWGVSLLLGFIGGLQHWRSSS